MSREKHPELVGALPSRMKLSGRVLGYLDGGTSALVAGSKGSRGVVQSTMPLRATTASGRPAPVDAALIDRGDRFAAVNPATPIEFPKQADGRIRIGALGVGLEPAGGSGPGVLRDGKVFYANTATDSDTTLLSLPTGAESFTELRSPASPEEIRLGFDLPAGQTLRASSAPHMSAEIVSGKKVIADVSAPTAYDAQKQSLPVTSTIQGSTLVLHVAHRSLDVAYPIVVDPQIGVLEPDGWYWNRYDSPGWGTYQSPGSQNWQLWRPEWGNGPFVGSRGLMTYGYYNPDGRYDYYPLNTGSEWNYYGEFWRYSTAYVYAFEEWNTLYPGYTGGGWTPPCAYSGIYSLTDGWENYAGRVCPQSNSPGNYGLFCAGGNCDAATSPGHYPNYMVFGTQGQGYAANFVYDLYAANVYLTDRDNPTVSGGPPGAWTDDTTFSAQANQTGLGVNQLAVSSPGNPGWQPTGWSSNCSAEPNYHCPATTPPLTASTSGLPEGTSTINATASTLSGHTLTQNIGQVKVDRTPPSLAFGGTLTNGAVISQDSTLNVDATDGSNDGNPADARSGVASIDITLDPGTPNAQQLEHVTQGACQGPGCPQTPPPAACTDPDNCSLTAAYTYPVADATPGTHTLQVVSTDNLGHASAPQNTTFVVDTIGPHLGVSGALWDHDGQTISQNLDLSAEAWADSGEGPGIQKIELSVDGTIVASASQALGQCQSADCGLQLPFTFDLAQSYASEGSHSIDIVATSFGGLTIDQHETINVTHLLSLASQNLDLTAPQDNLNGQPNLQITGGGTDHAGQSVTDIGDVNGDGLDDYLIGAPSAGLDTTGKPLAGAAYVVYGNASNAPVNLAALTPQQGFRIDGQLPGDYAGISVAALGDVNGDGTPDFAIGAPGTDGTLPALKPGKVYVIFGSKCSTATAPDPSCQSSTANANVDLGNLGTRGYEIDGPLTVPPLGGTAGHFGSVIASRPVGSYSTLGDVNGDGLDDVVIGSPDESNNGSGSGSAYVVYGKADSTPVNVANPGYGGYRIDGSAPNAALGSSVAIVGNNAGEDHADVAVGAPGDNTPNPATGAARANAGTVYVVRGAAMPTAVNSADLLNPSQSTGYAVYGANGDQLGGSIANIGDQNLDNLDDIGLGGAAHSYVIFGQEPTDDGAPVNPVDLSQTYPGYSITPPANTNGAPAQMAGAPDLNDSGQPSLLVSYPNLSNNGHTTNGAVYPILPQEGQDTPTNVDLSALPGQQGATLFGPDGAHAGSSIAGVDAASDGDSGAVIGAPTDASGAGRVYVVQSIALDGVPDDSTAPTDSPATASRAITPAAARRVRHKRSRCRVYGPNEIPVREVCGRLTYHSNVDHSHRRVPGGLGSPRGFPLSPKDDFTANARSDMARNKLLNDGPAQPALGGTHAWPIRDSVGKTFAYIAQLPDTADVPAVARPTGQRHSHDYQMWNASGQSLGHTADNPGAITTVQLNGTPCEPTMGAMRRDVFITVFHTGHPYDVRGIMDRAAFPIAAWANKAYGNTPDNDRLINTYYVPCNLTGFKRVPTKGPANQLTQPDFQTPAPNPNPGQDLYKTGLYDQPPTPEKANPGYHNPDITAKGTIPYENYVKGGALPRSGLLPNLLVLNSETTNVFGGAIAHAVIQTDVDPVIGAPPPGGGPPATGDRINYVDRAVPCRYPVVTRWYFVNANTTRKGRGIWQWAPQSERQGNRGLNCPD